MDTYRTIELPTQAQLTEKRSRFLAFVHHVENEDAVKECVARYKREYYDARHVCYAYVIGNNGEAIRSNDDGEPSGTAGRPILGQIVSLGLTYVLVVVVRYFGGVKLGTGPLGVAYKTAAAEALSLAQVVECVVTTNFDVAVPYTDADTAMRFVREAGAEITSHNYNAEGMILGIRIRLDDEAVLRTRLSRILSLRFLNATETDTLNS